MINIVRYVMLFEFHQTKEMKSHKVYIDKITRIQNTLDYSPDGPEHCMVKKAYNQQSCARYTAYAAQQYLV